MSQIGQYSAYWEAQTQGESYGEIIENSPEIRMSTEGRFVDFRRYRAMSRRERRGVKARVILRAILSITIPVSILYLGIYLDNPFIIVPALFLTLFMIVVSLYYATLAVKLILADIEISTAGKGNGKTASGTRGDPIDRLKMDFERSEMQNRERGSNPHRTDINSMNIEEPFRRK